MVQVQRDYPVSELLEFELEYSSPRAPLRTGELVRGRTFSRETPGVHFHDESVKTGARSLGHLSLGGTA